MEALTVSYPSTSLHRRGAVRAPDASGSRRLSHSSARGTHLSVDMESRNDPSRRSIDSTASGRSFGSSSSMLSLPTTPEPVFISLADTRLSFPVPLPHSKPSLSVHIPDKTPPPEPDIFFPHGPCEDELYPLHSPHSSSFSSPILPALLQPVHHTFPTTSELRSHPSIMVRRGYTIKRKTSAESAHADQEEMSEWERVRERRMNMADTLLARRKLDRKRDKRRSSKDDYVLDQEDSWYDPRDRAKHFQEWEKREARALANERKWREDVESDRAFRAYERGVQRESVVSWLQRLH